MLTVSLIGFMGSGKSSIGRAIVDLMPECRFIDLDDRIEERTGMSIPEIFSSRGEEGFRAIEYETLLAVLDEEEAASVGNSAHAMQEAKGSAMMKRSVPATNEAKGFTILSLGGGTPTQAACREVIMSRTESIYLRGTVDTLTKNLQGRTENRPMLRGEGDLRSKVERLMDARGPVYEACAKYILDIDGDTFHESAAKILKILGL